MFTWLEISGLSTIQDQTQSILNINNYSCLKEGKFQKEKKEKLWLNWVYQKNTSFLKILKKSNPKRLNQESVKKEAIDPRSILIYPTTIGQPWEKKDEDDECVHKNVWGFLCVFLFVCCFGLVFCCCF